MNDNRFTVHGVTDDPSSRLLQTGTEVFEYKADVSPTGGDKRDSLFPGSRG